MDIYEQQSSLGGVWNYDPATKAGESAIPQPNPHQPLDSPMWPHDLKVPTFSTPMYDGLETNIPDILMKHSDDASLVDHQLFPSRETVLRYLKDYGRDLKSLVQFSTQVIDATPEGASSPHRWRILSRNLLTSQTNVSFYDALIVANGHYAVPYVPEIAGVTEWNASYPGVINHSKFYQNSFAYRGKKTLIVGYAASGVDITFHISNQAKLPILVSRRSVSYLSSPSSYVEDVPEVVEFLPPSQGTRAVRFADGRIETDFEAVLFCTGYFHSYPFLSLLRPPVITSGTQVEQLYKHIFWIPDPTLAFVGLPSRVIPFRTSEGQASVIAKVWANRIRLPIEKEMQAWYTDLLEESGSSKSHVMDHPKDFLYHNELVSWSLCSERRDVGLISPKWSERDFYLRERFPAIKRAFNDLGEERHNIKNVEELGFDFDMRNQT